MGHNHGTHSWKQATCGECGRSYDPLKSTAKDWRTYCDKDCQRKADQGTSSKTGTTLTMPIGDAIQTAQDWITSRPAMPIVPLRKDCIHDGRLPIFTIGRGIPRKIYGARASSLMIPGTDLSHLDLILDASGMVKGPVRGFVRGGGKRFQDLNDLIFPEIVSLDWPDMSAPTRVRLKFWERLLAVLPEHTCISCIGGHGRTGSAMGALLVAGGMEGEEAIRQVREKHCKHAIETAGQADYIRSLSKQREE